MKSIKTMGLIAVSYLLTMQQAFAIDLGCIENPQSCAQAVPEIDGSGAIIAIGLLAGLVALFRERYFRK
jgi:hypothetical protein